MNRKDCSPRAATSRRPDCWPRTDAASFPWYSAGQPVLWWSPNPREILLPAEFKCSRSLAKTLRNRGFEIDFDRDFSAVVRACAARRENSTGTWITPEMHAAYCELHARGHAHSVEVRLAGELVGGLYGVLMGSVFFGESMFSRERDASKAALARLSERGSVAGLTLIDCQLPTPHLRSLGSKPVSRREFSALVAAAAAGPDIPLFSAPENCSLVALFWQNSRPSRVPQVPDVERRCDSDGRRSRRDSA